MAGITYGNTSPTSVYNYPPGQKPWYQYPIISTFGKLDAESNQFGSGAYWQPDANLNVPRGYAITSLYDGTVSSVQKTAWGQTVVTVKMSQPLNTLATHYYVEHLGDATVTQGEHVNPGQLIGHTSSDPTVARVGFGFYPGDVYGSGPEWQALQNDLKPGGAGLLNPTAQLNMFSQSPTLPTALQTTPGTCAAWDIACIWNNLSSGFAHIGLVIGFFLLGLVLIIIGFTILIHPNPETLLKGAELAA